MLANEADVLAQLREFGLEIDQLDVSGRLVRHRAKGSNRKEPGWSYLTIFRSPVDGNDYIVGAYGDWRRPDETQLIEWRPVDAQGARRKPTAEERDELRRQREEHRKAADQARAELAAEAANRARKLLSRFPTEGRCPYLQRKRVRGYGVRFVRGSLVVPLVNVATAALVGAQFVDEHGTKRFLTGTAKRGACHWLRKPPR